MFWIIPCSHRVWNPSPNLNPSQAVEISNLPLVNPKGGSNFLSFFSCSFREKVGQIIGWRPSFGVGSHPSGKSWMRHCQWWKWEGDLTSRTGNGNQQNSHALWRIKPLGRTSKTKPPCQFLYELPTTRSSSNVMYVM